MSISAPFIKKYNIISGCVNECVQQGRNRGKRRVWEDDFTCLNSTTHQKIKENAPVHAFHAHVELRCWIIQPIGEGRASFFLQECRGLSWRMGAFIDTSIWETLILPPPSSHFFPPRCFLSFWKLYSKRTEMFKHHFMLIQSAFTSITWAWAVQTMMRLRAVTLKRHFSHKTEQPNQCVYVCVYFMMQ